MTNKQKRLLLLVLLVTLGYCTRRKHDVKTDANVVSTNLQPQEVERINVNPQAHTITVIKRDEPVKTVTLPADRPVSITQDTQGKLSVEFRKWGTELQPFFGIGLTDGFGCHAGLSVFYVGRFDLNAGVSYIFGDNTHWRAFVGPSYNVFSHTNVFVAVDTTKHPYFGVFWRF